ncbi:hypothetical protein [Nonomuraea endophytica]|uniref:Uncharacterized protein n=1 Tax=Nonomuraea endophytica TaxID=714136 RepID=A0A7W8EJ19_9ACTN|nr:hypothetical protein [Nonomuraea endophytica]MBB5081143.1 hypothetical protein [Nonomuraea endophytica]
MRGIAAALTGITVALGVAAVPARADEDLGLRPSTVRAGGWVTVRLLCDPDAESGMIDGPTSFGEIPIDDLGDGRFEDDIRVPIGTPRGRQPVYGYCDDEDEPTSRASFTVVGGRPHGGAYTGFGGTAPALASRPSPADQGAESGLQRGAPGGALLWAGIGALALGGVAAMRRRSRRRG